VPVDIGLATLPFLPDAPAPDLVVGETHRDLVFAAQAKVPSERDERIRLLGWLVQAARRRPSRRVVVKVRAGRGEAQTHAETFDFADLLADPVVGGARGGARTPPPGGAALVTVSSTAVLEAIAAGIPAILVDEFGVSPKLINTVFEGSALFGGADDVAAWTARHPAASWLDDNYFHGREDDDWLAQLEGLLTRRATAPSPLRTRRYNLRGGALRRAFERKRMLGHHDRSTVGALSVAVALPARWVVRRVRRVRRRFESVPVPELVDAA
jgi:hypothetical protein